MVPTTYHPQNSPESLISYTIIATWLLWLVGGLYIAGPVLGCALAAQAVYFYYIAPSLPKSKRLPTPHWGVTICLVGMAVRLIVLVLGHLNFHLGAAATIKSSNGWAQVWFLIAMFVFAGAVLQFRIEVIYVSIFTTGHNPVMASPIFILDRFNGQPSTRWVVPLKVVGGTGTGL